MLEQRKELESVELLDSDVFQIKYQISKLDGDEVLTRSPYRVVKARDDLGELPRWLQHIANELPAPTDPPVDGRHDVCKILILVMSRQLLYTPVIRIYEDGKCIDEASHKPYIVEIDSDHSQHDERTRKIIGRVHITEVVENKRELKKLGQAYEQLGVVQEKLLTSVGIYEHLVLEQTAISELHVNVLNLQREAAMIDLEAEPIELARQTLILEDADERLVQVKLQLETGAVALAEAEDTMQAEKAAFDTEQETVLFRLKESEDATLTMNEKITAEALDIAEVVL